MSTASHSKKKKKRKADGTLLPSFHHGWRQAAVNSNEQGLPLTKKAASKRCRGDHAREDGTIR